MPFNDFQFLRLTVFNMPDDPRKISIESVRTSSKSIGRPPRGVPAPVKITAKTDDEQKQQTVYDLDMAHRNLPVSNLSFDIADDHFYRGYELVGRNMAKIKVKRRTETGWDTHERDVAWSTIRKGFLYRIREGTKTTESTQIEDLNATYRYLRLTVFNHDDKPLDIQNITAERRETSLLFENKPEENYTLLVGHSEARWPNFDLEHSTSLSALKTISHGPLTQIEHEEVLPPWTERNALVIWLVLILAVAGMVFMLTKHMRDIRTNDTEEQ